MTEPANASQSAQTEFIPVPVHRVPPSHPWEAALCWFGCFESPFLVQRQLPALLNGPLQPRGAHSEARRHHGSVQSDVFYILTRENKTTPHNPV